jgi:rod shape determining protein RodA
MTMLLQRKPDSGLGNIHASPSAPGRNIDWVLLLAQAALAVIGLFVIYSATQSKYPDNPFLFVTRQEIFLIVAMLAMVVVMAVDYRTWRQHAWFLYGATLVVLVLVIVAGTVSEGARLSFDIGAVRLQPAEFAKFTVTLALASYLADDKPAEESLPYHKFISGLLVVGAPTVLIILQPDLGSASVLIALVMGMLLVAGARAKYIALISVLSLATVGAAFAAGLVNQYQINRLLVFFDPDRCVKVRNLCYQANNSVSAIATGGLTGKGWLQGPLTNGRSDIPVQWADFPMSAVGEQFGLVGMAVIVALFALMLLRIWRIALLSKDMLGTYICAGAFTMTLWQMFQNIAMAMKLMPITGLPLPFISYGGSSLLAMFALLGLVQNVHMRRYR